MKTPSIKTGWEDASKSESRSLATPWDGPIFGMLFTFEMNSEGQWSFPWASAGSGWLLELTAQEMKEQPERVLGRLHAEDCGAALTGMRASLGSMEPYHGEWRVTLPKAGERWLRCKSMPESMPEGGSRWRGQLVDVTDWKISEHGWIKTAQMLSMVADATPNALFIGSPVGEGENAYVSLPYVSSGVGEVFGVEPREAMDDAFSIWGLFAKQERQRGLDVFRRARMEGSASARHIEFTRPNGERRRVRISVEWMEPPSGGEFLWVGNAEVEEEPERAQGAWDHFSRLQEGRLGAGFLNGLEVALRLAVEAKECRAEWFEDPLLWEVEEGGEIQWTESSAKLAIIDEARRPLGRVEIEWGFTAPRDLESLLMRVGALARAHWSKRRREQELEWGYEDARLNLEKSAKAASMGALVEGMAHDLSSPLGNGALSIEVLHTRAVKMVSMLEGEKIKRSDILALANGMAEVASAALGEVDKARGLLEALKKIASEQMRDGKSKQELGSLVADMRSSLHPTLRKRGVELSVEAARGEIWASVDVSKAFDWLAKITLAAEPDGGGMFAEKARLAVFPECVNGCGRLMLAMGAAEAKTVERALGKDLERLPDGRLASSLEIGPAQAGWEAARHDLNQGSQAQ